MICIYILNILHIQSASLFDLFCKCEPAPMQNCTLTWFDMYNSGSLGSSAAETPNTRVPPSWISLGLAVSPRRIQRYTLNWWSNVSASASQLEFVSKSKTGVFIQVGVCGDPRANKRTNMSFMPLFSIFNDKLYEQIATNTSGINLPKRTHYKLRKKWFMNGRSCQVLVHAFRTITSY